MKALVLSTLLVFAMIPQSALAWGKKTPALPTQQTPAKQSAGMSFEDLKEACLNPAKFQNQIAPSNLQVSCRDQQYKWIQELDGTFTLPTTREVTTVIFADKYTIAPVTGRVNSDPQPVYCGNYVEVVENVETTRALSCDEILSYKGNATEYCRDMTTSLKDANREAVNSQRTGRQFSLCSKSESIQQQYNQGIQK